MNRRIGFAPAAVMAVLAPVAVLAGTVRVAVDVAQEIVREDGQSRAVLRVSDLSFLSGQLVTRASLEIPLPARTTDRDLELYLYAAGRSWDAATVSWDTPWQRPGGDWSIDAFGRSQIEAGRARRSVRFDVAGILREIAEGREANTGFILVPGGGQDGDRFNGDERLLLSDLSNATLEVSHRPLPAKLRR